MIDWHLFETGRSVLRLSTSEEGEVESASALYAVILWESGERQEIEQGDPEVWVVRFPARESGHDPEADGPAPHEQAAAVVSAIGRALADTSCPYCGAPFQVGVPCPAPCPGWSRGEDGSAIYRAPEGIRA
jgi:hypothetical protein